jgi:two-component system, NarL family, nitrate/nitrite response regulator NarL
MAIRLVLVDDHALVLGGLERLLGSEPDFEVIQTCSTAAEGYRAVIAHSPDVLVLDLMLPDDGLSLLRRLDTTKPPAVIVLTAVQDEDILLDAARLGARGIVLKATAPRVLEDCIRAVYKGEGRLSVDGVDLSKRLVERQRVENELGDLLTPRELEILRLIALKLDNQEIADRLAISVGTVKVHLHHVYDKLHLNGRYELQVFLRDKRY